LDQELILYHYSSFVLFVEMLLEKAFKGKLFQIGSGWNFSVHILLYFSIRSFILQACLRP